MKSGVANTAAKPPIPGSALVPSAGFGVPPKRTFCEVAQKIERLVQPENRCCSGRSGGSSHWRDANANTRDACAPRKSAPSGIAFAPLFFAPGGGNQGGNKGGPVDRYLRARWDGEGQRNSIARLRDKSYDLRHPARSKTRKLPWQKNRLLQKQRTRASYPSHLSKRR